MDKWRPNSDPKNQVGFEVILGDLEPLAQGQVLEGLSLTWQIQSGYFAAICSGLAFFLRKMTSNFPQIQKDAQRQPEAPERDPTSAPRRRKGPQRMAKGSPGAPHREPKGAKGSPKAANYINKLPINCPSGRYVN